MCVNLGFFPGLSSCNARELTLMKFQLSFVDCFTALAKYKQVSIVYSWSKFYPLFVVYARAVVYVLH